jgi:triphosphoribosyl-dephospho-CoA synthase
MKNKSKAIAEAARKACVLEASAEKPGNVTPTRSFKDMDYQDFVKAAERLEPFIEKAARAGENAKIGKLIYDATSGKKNVNFGIIIMFMPLAATHGKSTKKLIQSLTIEDTKYIVKAMQKGRLGGMVLDDAKLAKYDILSEKIFTTIGQENITPLKLMEMSKPYDTLAREWVDDYPISRDIAKRIDSDLHNIAVEFLRTLGEFPDTLVARKRDLEEAEKISIMARVAMNGDFELDQFDAYLRSDGNALNPGTTADLIAAGLFLKLISKE